MLVALHNAVTVADGDVREIVRDRARNAGFDQVEFAGLESALDLIDRVTVKTAAPVDMAVVPYELPGMSGVQAVAEARTTQPLLYAIVVDDSPAHASEAARANCDDYLIAPLSSSSLDRACERAFEALRKLYSSSVLVDARGGALRIAFDDILYCETSGHDQILHLRDRSMVASRYSSQALFDLLSADERFYKVGSSYIVNLHEVRRLHTPSGELVLADGTPIPVPQRLRRDLEETLLAL